VTHADSDRADVATPCQLLAYPRKQINPSTNDFHLKFGRGQQWQLAYSSLPRCGQALSALTSSPLAPGSKFGLTVTACLIHPGFLLTC
jgi:hypothetical protein